MRMLLILLGLCLSLMAFSCHYQGENHLETVCNGEKFHELVTK